MPLSRINNPFLQVSSAGSAASPALTTSSDTNTGIFFPAADTIAFSEGGAEAMRIDSLGNVGIGTASPQGKLQVFASANDNLIVTGHVNASDGPALKAMDSTAASYKACEVLSAELRIGGTNGILFGTGGTGGSTERMRIDSSGNFMVNTTSTAGNASTFKSTAGAAQQAVSFWNNATTGTRYFVTFGTEASYTERGFITWNGTTTALSNASDFRLKENIVNAPSALQKIANIQIRSFDFKEDGRHVEYGVIAQELIGVIPAAVFEGSDNADGSINKAWSVGLEPIIPVLVKAIQEQQALITSLTARITALTARVDTQAADIAELKTKVA